MTKRLGEVICIACWFLAAALLWACFHQANGINIPLPTAAFLVGIPAAIGSMVYYVLSVRH